MILPHDIAPRTPMRIEPMAEVPTHFRLSVGWLLFAYVLGMLTVIGALWWGYQ